MSYRAQQGIEKLQAMEAALNEDQITADIDKVLNQKQSYSSYSRGGGDRYSTGGQREANEITPSKRNVISEDDGEVQPRISSPDLDRAPETADR